jgi:hypothetical protein
MDLGVRDAVVLGPVLAAHIWDNYLDADRLVEHTEKKCTRTNEIIGFAHVMAGVVAMSPKLRDQFSWPPINIYKIGDWLCWAVGRSSWAKSSMGYRLSGLD